MWLYCCIKYAILEKEQLANNKTIYITMQKNTKLKNYQFISLDHFHNVIIMLNTRRQFYHIMIILNIKLNDLMFNGFLRIIKILSIIMALKMIFFNAFKILIYNLTVKLRNSL